MTPFLTSRRSTDGTGRDRSLRRRAVIAAVAAALTILGLAVGASGASAAVTVPAHLPFGHLDRVTVAESVAHLAGYAIDPDTTAPINVKISVDGRTTATLTADQYNATFARNHPYYGGRHTFDTHLPVANGLHRICVAAVNVGRGHDVELGCASVTGQNDPVGAITAVSHTAAGVTLTGWALDPNTTAPAQVSVSVDAARPVVSTANTPTTLPTAYQSYGPGHGFAVTIPATRAPHAVCASVTNIGAGSPAGTSLGCRTAPEFVTTPNAPTQVATLVTTSSATLAWVDPTDDGGSAITGYTVTGQGITPQTVPATATRATVPGLKPATGYALSVAAINAIGTGAAAVVAVTTAGAPPSAPQSVSGTPATTGITIKWAAPTDTGGLPVTEYRIARSGASTLTLPATARTAAVTGLKPATSYQFSIVAVNVVGTSEAATLAVKTAGSVPTAVQKFTGTAPNSSSVNLAWAAPTNTGNGLSLTGYRIVRAGVTAITLPASARSTTVSGLKASTRYSFSIVALNVLGASPAATSTVTTAAALVAQTSPAPVSTSHYLRDLTGSATHDVAEMRAMGASDAGYNPSGHRYLVLLHMGGQYRGGAILSATTKWISYSAQVTAVDAYIDGYHSAQKANAPVLIAVSTNNDGSVSRADGITWATSVVNPIAAHARQFANVSVAGGDDMEPGFFGGPAASRAWLDGFLGATERKFVFVGSADGCPLTSSGHCNNGWTTSTLHYLSGGAAPSRIISMPQIYNTAMPLQWRTISADGPTKVNFGGPLTEWTACAQAHSCFSETNVSAWHLLYDALASDQRTRMAALPFGTDLRIN